MSRDWRLYLAEVVAYAETAQRITAGMTREEVAGDERTWLAVLHALQIVGEAARYVPPEVTRQAPHVPWKRVVGFRNWVAHGYWAVREDVVWNVLVHDLVPLRDAAASLLADADRADLPPP